MLNYVYYIRQIKNISQKTLANTEILKYKTRQLYTADFAPSAQNI